ncbi:recombinase family protein [Streptomyces shenzhenensis]|uniref:recombinase family protein n=1 Tax=Streptomyces shenzhenensis TaxID=943815 RepID=UPI001F30600D|nr:recombinase family protein [Streptomyces shenzhenensis]
MAIRQRNTTKQKPGRLVIYARISDEREGRQNGVKRQEQQCRRIAEQDGDEVVRVFVDDDRSAYSGKIRPDYANMIKYLEAGHADGVLALAPTRLYRKLYEPKTRQDYLHFHDLVNRLDLHVQTVKAGRFEPPPRPADAEGRTGSLRKTLSGTGPSDLRGRWSSPPGWSGSTASPARILEVWATPARPRRRHRRRQPSATTSSSTTATGPSCTR